MVAFPSWPRALLAGIVDDVLTKNRKRPEGLVVSGHAAPSSLTCSRIRPSSASTARSMRVGGALERELAPPSKLRFSGSNRGYPVLEIATHIAR